MKLVLKLTMVAAVAAGALSLTSCGGGCCTGEDPVPPLRPLPNFDAAPVVDYSK